MSADPKAEQMAVSSVVEMELSSVAVMAVLSAVQTAVYMVGKMV